MAVIQFRLWMMYGPLVALVSIVKLKPTLHGMTVIFRDEKQLRDVYFPCRFSAQNLFTTLVNSSSEQLMESAHFEFLPQKYSWSHCWSSRNQTAIGNGFTDQLNRTRKARHSLWEKILLVNGYILKFEKNMVLRAWLLDSSEPLRGKLSDH